MVAGADFEAWYRAEHPRLVSSMLLLTGSLDEATEATDEALARALARWNQVSAMESPGGWTYRVAVNVVRRRARRRALESRLLRRKRRDPPAEDLPLAAGDAWGHVVDLPLRQRQVVILRHVADLTEPDIAAILGISRSTVSSTLADAHHTLGRRLGGAPVPEEVP